MKEHVIEAIKDEMAGVKKYKELYDKETDPTRRAKLLEIHNQENAHKTALMQMYGVTEEEVSKDRIKHIKYEMSELMEELDSLL